MLKMILDRAQVPWPNQALIDKYKNKHIDKNKI